MTLPISKVLLSGHGMNGVVGRGINKIDYKLNISQKMGE
jgi:hypothetical protein